MDSIQERFASSWETSWVALKEREDAGIQPGPYIMLESDGKKLAIANIFYLCMIVVSDNSKTVYYNLGLHY